MKRQYIPALAALYTLMCVCGCEEIFNDDLTGYPVRLQAPADSAVLADTQVQLSWTPMEVSAVYQLQLVQPRFDTVMQVVKDTITQGSNAFVSSLVKGKQYQWRVRAIGSSSVSPYSKPATFFLKQ